jgi:siroheme synthase-like protein
MLPITVNLKDRLAAVIGGGKVGKRKAKSVLASGSRVRLVCREPQPDDMPGDDRLEWVTADFQSIHLAGASLVFAAATAEVNQTVAREARQRGIWVNIADDPVGSDFHLPAVLRCGELLIGIGTAGAAPILSRRVRDRLAEQFDETFATWVRLLGQMRFLAREIIKDPVTRHDRLAMLADWKWLERLRLTDEATVAAEMTRLVQGND